MRGQLLTSADGSVLYVTIDGDMIDEIAHSYYGNHRNQTEAIYAANPAIADMDIVLPAGVTIKLPAVPKQETPRTFRRLWD